MPARLIVQDGEGDPTTHELSKTETLIGRRAASDVQLKDRAASRDHATISFEGDRYVIEDLQTTNGTKINGKRIRSAVLEDGDRIEVGHTVITFKAAS